MPAPPRRVRVHGCARLARGRPAPRARHALRARARAGVRCLASIGGTPCDFNLTATALPFELYDGLDLLAYTKPDYPVGGAPWAVRDAADLRGARRRRAAAPRRRRRVDRHRLLGRNVPHLGGRVSGQRHVGPRVGADAGAELQPRAERHGPVPPRRLLLRIHRDRRAHAADRGRSRQSARHRHRHRRVHLRARRRHHPTTRAP